MASSKEYLDFILEQISELEAKGRFYAWVNILDDGQIVLTEVL